MLHIENLKKQYGSDTVLDIADLRIEQGIYWLKGDNGTGKTTFFKSVAGFFSDLEGEILLDGQYGLRQQPEAYRLRVNYAEAEPLYPEFISGMDLLGLVASAKKSPEGQLQELLDRFTMMHYVSNPIGSYSSGMLKKLSLVAAFLGNPLLMLLDEPLITIDKQSSNNLLDLIRAKHQAGVSFFLSSHQDFPPHTLNIQQVFELKNKTLEAV